MTKKPWYLGGEQQQEPTLEHQSVGLAKKDTLSLQASEALLQAQREKERSLAAQQKFVKGMWVEALKRNKLPYKIAKITRVNKHQNEFDLEYEDGSTETRVKLSLNTKRPRIRMTKTGNRSAVGVDSYDSKRDAYHGYDADTHNARVSAKFEERESLRRKFREQLQKDEPAAAGGDEKKKDKDNDDDESDFSSDSDNDDEEEYVQRDEDDKVITTRLARQGGVGGAQMKVTARNLRIREDTAKYLRNLDIDSAYYDPKSRSMRDNPNPEVAPDESQFAGENFTRITGDATSLAQTQLFAWEAEKKGVAEIHPQANPSQAEMLQKKFKTQAADLKLQQKKAVLDKYGGAEYLDGAGGLASAAKDEKERNYKPEMDRKLRFGVTTTKIEYSQDGRRVNGKEIKREAIPCKYEEDIFINGHSTVWGSYLHKGAMQWGYADDHSLIKMSYCTGPEGRLANDEANEMKYGTGQVGSAALAQARGMLKASTGGSAKSGGTLASNAMLNRSKLYGEANQSADLDQSKVQEALKKSKQEKNEKDDRKRKYHSLNVEENMTEEEMEAYRLMKERSSDPMAKLGADEVLDYK